jgi:hypothetical protein
MSHAKHHGHHHHHGHHGGLILWIIAALPGAAGLLICLDGFVLGGAFMLAPPLLFAICWVVIHAAQPRAAPRW